MSGWGQRVVLVVGLSGCGTYAEMSATDGFTGGDGAVASSSGSEGGSGSTAELTAGAWDDTLNYDWFSEYVERTADLPGAPMLAPEERDAANALFAGARDAKVDLDVALLFDTTGSMGDELEYLTDEIDRIAGAIEDVAPDAEVRWGLVVYRDHGDAYVTRSIDFTRDLDAFRKDLDKQRSGGGGDYPEASPEGLRELLQLSWRDRDDVARMAFWVADAPHHPEAVVDVTTALRDAAAADVHLYPVAASGTDELAELTMRSGAQLTGGRYLFLTDDSGIGGAHKEPTLPCYFVTTLSDAMVRMVEIERSGVYVEPDEDQVIRTGGDPQDGRCTLDDGSELIAF